MRLIDFARSLTKRRKEKEKQEYLKELSHEMKTPLTIIICYAQLLKDEEKYNLEKNFTRAINSIETEGKRLTILIDKYIDFSK